VSALYALFVALVLLKYYVLTGSSSLVIVLSNITLGGIYGFSILLLGALLFFMTPRRARLIIFVGAILAVLLFPLLNTASLLDIEATKQVLYLIVLFAYLFILLLGRDFGHPIPPSAKAFELRGITKKKWREIFFAQSKAVQMTLFMTIPFFFCNGVFSSFTFDLGYTIVYSNHIMLTFSIVLVAICLIDSFKKNASWFNILCFVVECLYIIIVCSLVLFVDFQLEAFGIMQAGIILLKIWLLLFLTETSIKQSISPIFLYGIFALMHHFPFVVGDSLAFLSRPLFADPVSVLASGCLMTIAISVFVIVFLLINGKDSTPSPNPPLPGYAEDNDTGLPNIATENQGKQFDSFCTIHGLSEMETKVILLYSQGRSVRNISSKLFISESTTRTYIQRVYAKCIIHNKQELLDLIDGTAEKA
jgi:DNA-binding CsgD family transcriptional regulator